MSTPYHSGGNSYSENHALETLTNLIYSLQNNPEILSVTLKLVEENYNTIYGPVFEINYQKSLKDFLSDHPRQFYISGESVFLKGDTFVPRDRDPGRRTQRGIKPRNRPKEPASPMQMEFRKRIFEANSHIPHEEEIKAEAPPKKEHVKKEHKKKEKKKKEKKKKIPKPRDPTKSPISPVATFLGVFRKKKKPESHEPILEAEPKKKLVKKLEKKKIEESNNVDEEEIKNGDEFDFDVDFNDLEKKRLEGKEEDYSSVYPEKKPPKLGEQPMDHDTMQRVKKNEAKLRNLVKGGLSIYDYQRKKKDEEERLARQLEEEVERAERMEKRKKEKEELARKKRQDKLRRREEKKKRREEKRKKKLEQKKQKQSQGGSGGGISFRSKGLGGMNALMGFMKESDTYLKSQQQYEEDEAKMEAEAEKESFGDQTFSEKSKAPKNVMISEPKNIHRVGRVRIDSKKGFIFENVQSKIKDLFEESGIPPDMIHEEKQAKRIYEMLIRRGTLQGSLKDKFLKFEDVSPTDGPSEIDIMNEIDGEMDILPMDGEFGEEKEVVDIEVENLNTKELKKLLCRVKDELSIRDHLLDEDERLECIVCFENYREIMFYPCHHVLLCPSCANIDESKKKENNSYDVDTWKQCPFCRSSVECLKKVFF